MTEDSSNPPDSPLKSSAERLKNELDHWLEVAWSQGEKALDVLGVRGDRPWTPSAEVIEMPNDVLVLLDLPGVNSDEIDVALTGNMLTVKGNRPKTSIGDSDTRHVSERSTGDFTRSIPLPIPVDADAINAEMKDGVLRITLAKAERAKPRPIPIKTTE